MNKILLCIRCGKTLTGKQEKYCSLYCSKLWLKSEYRKRYKEKVNEYNREYLKKHPEKAKLYKKRYLRKKAEKGTYPLSPTGEMIIK